MAVEDKQNWQRDFGCPYGRKTVGDMIHDPMQNVNKHKWQEKEVAGFSVYNAHFSNYHPFDHYNGFIQYK